MPIRVKCAQCGKILQAPDTAAGKRVKCSFCSAVFVVPTPRKAPPATTNPEIQEALAAARARAASTSAERAERPKSASSEGVGDTGKKKALLILGIGAAVLILGKIAGIFPLVIMLGMMGLIFAGWWKIFAKAGEPGWAIFVPVYNVCVLLKIAGKPIWWLLLFFIPCVSIIFMFLAFKALAERFGKGIGFAIGLLFLPMIFYPVLGLGSAAYGDTPDSRRQQSGGKYIPAVVAILIILAIGLMFVPGSKSGASENAQFQDLLGKPLVAVVQVGDKLTDVRILESVPQDDIVFENENGLSVTVFGTLVEGYKPEDPRSLVVSGDKVTLSTNETKDGVVLFGQSLRFNILVTDDFLLEIQGFLDAPKPGNNEDKDRTQGAAPPAAEAHKTVTVELTNGAMMEFVLIPSGSFIMGCETRKSDEKPVHKVTITKPFCIGKYEVTQEQWQAIMGDNPSKFKNPKNPVEQVSWEDCRSFVDKLNEQVPGYAFRMPTEAEWEYACRAGTTTEYYGGDDVGGVDAYGWHSRNSGGTTHPVGEKKANAWGIYDMHGNVWENCSDWHDEQYYASSPERDPTGGEATEFGCHVSRGGSFGHDPYFLRSSLRGANSDRFKNEAMGLRLACTAQE